MEDTVLQTNSSLHNPDRLLDGPLLIFDLPYLMEKIVTEDSWQKNKRNAITLLKNENMRLVLIDLSSGEEINFRQSDNLISLQLMKGEVEFNTENKIAMLKQGQLLTHHENMQHSLVAIGETIFLLTVGNSIPIEV